jgi:hypothetical protein
MGLLSAAVMGAAGRVRVQKVWMEREKFEGMAGGLRIKMKNES